MHKACKKHLQRQTTENILDVLTVVWKAGCGSGEAADRSPQHLQLREGNLPLTCVLLN